MSLKFNSTIELCHPTHRPPPVPLHSAWGSGLLPDRTSCQQYGQQVWINQGGQTQQMVPMAYHTLVQSSYKSHHLIGDSTLLLGSSPNITLHQVWFCEGDVGLVPVPTKSNWLKPHQPWWLGLIVLGFPSGPKGWKWAGADFWDLSQKN